MPSTSNIPVTIAFAFSAEDEEKLKNFYIACRKAGNTFTSNAAEDLMLLADKIVELTALDDKFIDSKGLVQSTSDMASEEWLSYLQGTLQGFKPEMQILLVGYVALPRETRMEIYMRSLHPYNAVREETPKLRRRAEHRSARQLAWA